MCRQMFAVMSLSVSLSIVPHISARAAVPANLVFGNDFVAVRLSFPASVMRLDAIDNRLTGEQIKLRDARFRLIFDDGTRVDSGQCVVEDVATEEIPVLGRRLAGRQLTIRLATADRAVHIQVIYEARTGEHWIERTIHVSGPPSRLLTARCACRLVRRWRGWVP